MARVLRVGLAKVPFYGAPSSRNYGLIVALRIVLAAVVGAGKHEPPHASCVESTVTVTVSELRAARRTELRLHDLRRLVGRAAALRDPLGDATTRVRVLYTERRVGQAAEHRAGRVADASV